MFIHSLTEVRYRKARVLDSGTIISEVEFMLRSGVSVVVGFFFYAIEEAAKLDDALAAVTVEDGIILSGVVALSYHGVKNIRIEDSGDTFRICWEDRRRQQERISAFR